MTTSCLARTHTSQGGLHANDRTGSDAPDQQYIYVDDVGELWNAVKEQWTAEWGPEKMAYELIEFAVKDPNGYLLSFGRQPNSRLARVRI